LEGVALFKQNKLLKQRFDAKASKLFASLEANHQTKGWVISTTARPVGRRIYKIFNKKYAPCHKEETFFSQTPVYKK